MQIYIPFLNIILYFAGTSKLEVIEKTIQSLHINIDNDSGSGSSSSSSSSSEESSSIISTKQPTSLVLSLLAKHVKAVKPVSTLEDELDRFSNVMCNEESILEFWKTSEKDFPKLGKIAKTLLGIPMSSSKSESAFSVAGSLIRKDRAAITPYRIEKTLFIHDNYDILKM